MQASGGTVSWALWRKGKCKAQTSQHFLEAELKLYVKAYNNLFRQSTVQNVMNPSISCTSEVAITLPSKLSREVVVSTRAVLVWKQDALCKKWHKPLHQCQSENQKDKSDVIRWQRSCESRCYWMTQKYWIDLKADIVPFWSTGKINTLV